MLFNVDGEIHEVVVLEGDEALGDEALGWLDSDLESAEYEQDADDAWIVTGAEYKSLVLEAVQAWADRQSDDYTLYRVVED